MDKRKPSGRTQPELDVIFQRLPLARLCFDIGHAWQVDPTMNEAYEILKCYRERILQVHVSEVNSRSKHDVLSYSTIQSFRDIAHMIPSVPLILETPVLQSEMRQEMNKVRFALLPITADMVA
jgi:endonuclease IV